MVAKGEKKHIDNIRAVDELAIFDQKLIYTKKKVQKPIDNITCPRIDNDSVLTMYSVDFILKW